MRLGRVVEGEGKVSGMVLSCSMFLSPSFRSSEEVRLEQCDLLILSDAKVKQCCGVTVCGRASGNSAAHSKACRATFWSCRRAAGHGNFLALGRGHIDLSRPSIDRILQIGDHLGILVQDSVLTLATYSHLPHNPLHLHKFLHNGGLRQEEER